MKIGSLDVKLPTLIYIALVVVACVACFQAVMSKWSQRTEGRLAPLIRESLNAVDTASWQEGVQACDDALAQQSTHVPVLLAKGTLLYRMKDYADAEEAFEEAASAAGKAQQEAMGWTGAAASVFARLQKKDQPKAIQEAEAYLQKAIKADDSFPDAKISLAVISLWKNTDEENEKAVEVLTELATGMDKNNVAGLEAVKQLYHAQGVAFSRKDMARESDDAFDKARNLDPSSKGSDESRQMAVLRGLVNPDLDLKARMEIISETEKGIRKFGDLERDAMNALGVSLWQCRKHVKQSDYDERYYPRALSWLNKTVSRFKKDPAAFWNTAGLIEDRLYGSADDETLTGMVDDLPQDLFVHATDGMTHNPWKTGVFEASRRKFSMSERRALSEVSKLAMAEHRVLTNLVQLPKLSAKEIKKANMHLMGVLNLLEAVSLVPDTKRKYGAALLRVAKAVFEQGKDDPAALLVYAKIMARNRKYKEANAALAMALKSGGDAPELREMAHIFGRIPTFYDVRPRNARYYGNQLMITATATAPSTPERPELTLFYDNEEQAGARVNGTQILFLPDESLLGSGQHIAKVKAVDAVGNVATVTIPLYVDSEAPRFSVSPAANSTIEGPHPVLNLTLKDAGVGVEFAQIKVELRSVSVVDNPVSEALIVNDVYKSEMKSLEIMAGALVSTETFKVTSFSELTAGKYQLRVTYSDRAGNGRVQTVFFTVK